MYTVGCRAVALELVEPRAARELIGEIVEVVVDVLFELVDWLSMAGSTYCVARAARPG
ncbi:MAG: hypothetical protein JO023_15920 [Chloroflexi bacterium]|nr:hypothetical protein [Chloroflexota bacterium]